MATRPDDLAREEARQAYDMVTQGFGVGSTVRAVAQQEYACQADAEAAAASAAPVQ